MDAAECQERLKLKLDLCGGVYKLITDHELVCVLAKDKLLAEDDFSNLVRYRGDGICVEIHNVLVSARFIHFPVAVDAQVEALASEGKAFIQGAQEKMHLAAELLDRYGQEAVVTPRIAGHD